MKAVLFILKKEYPYLNELKNRIKNEGIFVSDSFDEVKAKEYADNTCVITDCEDGINIAVNNGIGFIFYETDYNKGLDYKEAQCVLMGFEELEVSFIIKMYERFKGIPWTIAKTQRCIICESKVNDLDRFYEIYEDDKIRKYCQRLCDNKESEKEKFRAYIRNMYQFFGFGMWNIVKKEDNRLIGRAGLFLRDGFDDIELGYLIEESERNKGYAYECCSKILDIARQEYGCEKIRALISPDNKESLNLAKKLGFYYAGDIMIEQKMTKIYEFVYN